MNNNELTHLGLGLPFFITSPHSGEQIPDECSWLKQIPESVLMRDVDRFVDRLYEPSIQELQIPFIKTQWHRYAVDLNRVPSDIDQSSVVGAPHPAGKFSRGFHWVMTTHREILLPQPMSQDLHQKLMKLIYEPFHDLVKSQYHDFKNQGFKTVYHLDAHSMPSVGTSEHRDPGERRADIVVSDCKGLSCSSFYKDLVISSYEKAGFQVKYNWPYFGGRVTEQYGHPQLGQEAIQVEMNRALYMDENTQKIKPESVGVIEQLKVALRNIQIELHKKTNEG